MKADERRNAIMGILIKEKRAIKGTTLAENFNVTSSAIIIDKIPKTLLMIPLT